MMMGVLLKLLVSDALSLCLKERKTVLETEAKETPHTRNSFQRYWNFVSKKKKTHFPIKMTRATALDQTNGRLVL